MHRGLRVSFPRCSMLYTRDDLVRLVIRVIDSVDCSGAIVESCDPWIPMKVTWEPRSGGRPLYLRISGSGGGEAELKIDSVTGMLMQAIVIQAPPRIETTSQIPRCVATRCQSPVVDHSLWGWQGRSEGVMLDQSIASTIEDLAFVREMDRIELILSNQESERYLYCENVVVAISVDGNLVGITAFLT